MHSLITLSINVLEYESNKKAQHFLSSMFQYNMIPTTNKPTHVTRDTATAIDHIVQSRRFYLTEGMTDLYSFIRGSLE